GTAEFADEPDAACGSCFLIGDQRNDFEVDDTTKAGTLAQSSTLKKVGRLAVGPGVYGKTGETGRKRSQLRCTEPAAQRAQTDSSHASRWEKHFRPAPARARGNFFLLALLSNHRGTRWTQGPDASNLSASDRVAAESSGSLLGGKA